MTVKELMAELAKHPEDMEVFVVHQKQSCGMMRPIYFIEMDEDPESDEKMEKHLQIRVR